MTTPSPASATFETELWTPDGTNAGIVVPEEVVLGLGRGKRVPVVVTVSHGEQAPYSYRSTVAVMGGKYLLSFNKGHREATGLGAGDAVTVRLDVDDAPRTVEVPPELARALAGQDGAEAAWDALSPSKKRLHAESVAGAKTDATRERRVQKVLDALG